MSDDEEVDELEDVERAKPRKSKWDKKRLPKKIIPITSADKRHHEKWSKSRDLLDFPCPSRICICARPNSGKTSFIKNHIVRAKPPYKKIWICHYDAPDTDDPNAGTLEYDDVQGIMIKDLPDPRSFDRKSKKLLILEDIDMDFLSKEDKAKLSRLFGYASTHKQLTVICACQCAFSIPPIVRRSSTIFVLYDSPDRDSLATLARKTGLTAKDIKAIFDNLMPNRYDFLVVDTEHPNPRYRLRKNGYQLVIKKDKDE